MKQEPTEKLESRRKVRLIEHIRRYNNLESLERGIIADFNSRNPDDNVTVLLTAASLPASGKSKFLKQWMSELDVMLKQETKPDALGEYPRILRSDFRELIQIGNRLVARKIGRDDHVEYVGGKITPTQYDELAAIETKLRELALQKLPGRSLFVYETVLVSETFDHLGNPVGVKRGNIENLKQLAKDHPSYLMFMYRDELERRADWIDRRDDLYTNPEIAKNFEMQFDLTLLNLLQELHSRGEVGIDELQQFQDLSTRESRAKLADHYLTTYGFNRIAQGIFGNEVDKRFILIQNPKVEDGIQITQEEDPPNTFISELISRAQAGDLDVKQVLDELAIPV